jgi:hypothetical protein
MKKATVKIWTRQDEKRQKFFFLDLYIMPFKIDLDLKMHFLLSLKNVFFSFNFFKEQNH